MLNIRHICMKCQWGRGSRGGLLLHLHLQSAAPGHGWYPVGEGAEAEHSRSSGNNCREGKYTLKFMPFYILLPTGL